MSDRGKRGYIPWHERIDEELIKELARQFANRIVKEGMRPAKIEFHWDENGREFSVSIYGSETKNYKH